MSKIRTMFCSSCKIPTKSSMEDVEKQFMPRICIGHIALFIGAIALVCMEWLL